MSVLGFGAMHINDDRVSEGAAATLLNKVLDSGISLIDTARSYGLSEERIGRYLAHRRNEFVLSTKLGYGVDGVPDWTYDCIVQGVERALRLMRTEVLDIAHLHSCPLEILQRGDVTRALHDCRRAGKIRAAAYAGDNAELACAIGSGDFDIVQTSINLCDQSNLEQRLPQAAARGVGVIAKRPIAGAVWRRSARPSDHAEGVYWDRWQAMRLDQLMPEADWQDLALRFGAYLPGVTSCIVGTSKMEHLERNLAAVARGPLPADQAALLRQRFAVAQRDWSGVI